MQSSKSALFLDRDGVINVNYGYVFKPEKFTWINGIFELVKRANEANMLVFVVTNQSGIGRGYYSEEDFLALNKWMIAEFKNADASIDSVYWCPHHPEDALGDYRVDCNCRKPKTGMIDQAIKEYSIALSNSVLIGDKASDIHTAINAGIGNAYWLGATDTMAQELAEHKSRKTIIKPLSNLNDIRF